MVYGVWCTVYGVRCMVYGVRCKVYGVAVFRSGFFYMRMRNVFDLLLFPSIQKKEAPKGFQSLSSNLMLRVISRELQRPEVTLHRALATGQIFLSKEIDLILRDLTQVLASKSYCLRHSRETVA